MATFLNHRELRKEILSLFEEAENSLMIVSPFIKLDERLKQLLKEKVKDDEFHLRVLYGKNNSDHTKSIGIEDINFFKSFENVEIRYNENLHAKYYANESKCIVTSLNLHEFSLKKNIESGVLFEHKFFGRDNKNDDTAYGYFEDVFDDSDLIFEKFMKKKKLLWGFGGSRKLGSVVKVDDTEKIFNKQKPANVPDFEKPSGDKHYGFCIRTGQKIEFNMDRPLSREAYKNWAETKNPNHPENYCHFSGKESFGKTSLKKPVLIDHYSEAMKRTKK